MHKFCLAIVLFVFLLFSAALFNNADAESESVRGVSDRVKVERTETQDEKKTGKKEKEPVEAAETKKTETKAVEANADVSAEDGALDLMGEKKALYVRKGRPDPFAPFVSQSEPSTQQDKVQKKLQRRKPRTPLERMSLGQLQLTAVMETGDQNIALVEEASGKGYVVKKGTYIGNEGGRVTEILPNSIVIEEKYLDVFGNVDVRKKQLKLQK